ncbi:MAG: hypothetical protein AB7V46_22115 [Thermomicrobiales bacterium]
MSEGQSSYAPGLIVAAITILIVLVLFWIARAALSFLLTHWIFTALAVVAVIVAAWLFALQDQH